MQRESSARRNAVGYLNKLIGKYRSRGMGRLPTIDEMSRSAGVAKGTMQKVVSAFVAQGVLGARAHRGTTIIDSPKTLAVLLSPPQKKTPQKQVWLMETICADIINGRYRQGVALPSIKGLCGRYGTGYGTAKKALDHLVQEKQLVIWKRGYRVPAIVTTGHQNTIIIAAWGTDKGISMGTYRMAEYLTVVEHECFERRIRILYVPIYYQGKEIRRIDEFRRILATSDKRQNLMGALMFPQAIPSDAIRGMIGLLEEHNVPVSVILESDSYSFDTSPGRMVRHFAIAWGTESGRDVGRLLSRSGHKKVAYITRNVDADWTRRRYAGLSEAMTSMQNPDPVSFIHLAETLDDWPMLDFLSANMPQLDAIHRHNPVITRTLLWPEGEIRAYMQGNAQLTKNSRMLEAVLQDRDITAWVGDNDITAVLCLDLLHQHGIQVPGQISVIGFDDGHAAMVNSLTSYNFNCRSLMHAALRHVLEPKAVRKMGERTVEIGGYIAQRATSGPAPRNKRLSR
jgi:DNA-binding LacI/PurR family transcriptional regulator